MAALGEAAPDRHAKAGDLFRVDAVGGEDAQHVVLELEELRDVCPHHAAKPGKKLVEKPVRGHAGKPRVAQRRLAGRRVRSVSGHRGHDRTAGAPDLPASAA